MSATPSRGPRRFIPVLTGQEVFKVPLPSFQPHSLDPDITQTTSKAAPACFQYQETVSQQPATVVTSAQPRPTSAAGSQHHKPVAAQDTPISEPETTKFLVNWVPRLIGRKLVVEGNLLDLRYCRHLSISLMRKTPAVNIICTVATAITVHELTNTAWFSSPSEFKLHVHD